MNSLAESKCSNCNEKDACFIHETFGPRVPDIEHMDMHFSKGESLFKQGTIAPHIIYLKEGMAKLYLEHRDRKQPLCIEKKGFLGLESMYNDKYYQYSAVALTDAEVCLIEIDTLKEAIGSSTDLAIRVITDINTRSKYIYQRFLTLTQKQGPGRVADVLLCFTDRIFLSDTFELPCTRKEIAEMASLSLESLSRILKEFKDEGIVEAESKNIHVTDIERLRFISSVS